MEQLKMYKHNVSWTGFNGRKKQRDLEFVITKTSVIENFETYQSFETLKEKVREMYEAGSEFLSSSDALMVLDMGLLVIKLAYAEVDMENDIVDKTDETVNKFLSSLAYEALMTQILDKPELMLDLINNITDLIPTDEETKKEITRLQQEYLNRTTIQNDDNHGQEPVLSAEELRIQELQKELSLLQGGKQ